MLFFLFIVYIFQYDARALPVPIWDNATSATATTGSTVLNRNLLTIVWSCVSTVVICAWVSVHPNVPPRNQKMALLRRFEMMIWTIIAPELVLAWAARQWFAARMVAHRYKGHGWTVAHGHFLVMGGFTLVHTEVNMPQEPEKPKGGFSVSKNGDEAQQRTQNGDEVQQRTQKLVFGRYEDEEERHAEEKERYEEAKRRYEEEKERYRADKEHIEEEKRHYEGSRRGDKERWRYEKERRCFEEGRKRYELFQNGYNLEIRRHFDGFRDRRQTLTLSLDHKDDIFGYIFNGLKCISKIVRHLEGELHRLVKEEVRRHLEENLGRCVEEEEERCVEDEIRRSLEEEALRFLEEAWRSLEKPRRPVKFIWRFLDKRPLAKLLQEYLDQTPQQIDVEERCREDGEQSFKKRVRRSVKEELQRWRNIDRFSEWVEEERKRHPEEELLQWPQDGLLDKVLRHLDDEWRQQWRDAGLERWLEEGVQKWLAERPRNWFKERQHWVTYQLQQLREKGLQRWFEEGPKKWLEMRKWEVQQRWQEKVQGMVWQKVRQWLEERIQQWFEVDTELYQWLTDGLQVLFGEDENRLFDEELPRWLGEGLYQWQSGRLKWLGEGPHQWLEEGLQQWRAEGQEWLHEGLNQWLEEGRQHLHEQEVQQWFGERLQQWREADPELHQWLAEGLRQWRADGFQEWHQKGLMQWLQCGQCVLGERLHQWCKADPELHQWLAEGLQRWFEEGMQKWFDEGLPRWLGDGLYHWRSGRLKWLGEGPHQWLEEGLQQWRAEGQKWLYEGRKQWLEDGWDLIIKTLMQWLAERLMQWLGERLGRWPGEKWCEANLELHQWLTDGLRRLFGEGLSRMLNEGLPRWLGEGLHRWHSGRQKWLGEGLHQWLEEGLQRWCAKEWYKGGLNEWLEEGKRQCNEDGLWQWIGTKLQQSREAGLQKEGLQQWLEEGMERWKEEGLKQWLGEGLPRWLGDGLWRWYKSGLQQWLTIRQQQWLVDGLQQCMVGKRWYKVGSRQWFKEGQQEWPWEGVRQWLEKGKNQWDAAEKRSLGYKEVLKALEPDIQKRQGRLQRELQSYEDELQRYEKEEQRYQEERERYQEERQRYEKERMWSKEERATNWPEQQRLEEERIRYEEEQMQYEEKLLSYEDKLRRYNRRLRQYKENCQHYQLGPLSFDHFCELVQEAKIKFPTITEDELKDRSKGDFLFKALAILKTTYFLVQCVARRAQGLALTELELATLALASLNAVTYFFWWNKPLGVQDPVKVYLKTEETPRLLAEDECVNDMDDVTLKSVRDKLTEFLKKLFDGMLRLLRNPSKGGPLFIFSILIPFVFFSVVFFSPFPLVIAFLLDTLKTNPPDNKQSSENYHFTLTRIILFLHNIRYKLTSSIRKFFRDRFNRTLEWESLSYLCLALYIVFPSLFILFLFVLLVLLPVYTLLFFISFLFTSTYGIITTVTFHAGETQVPVFYAPKTDSDRYSRMLIFALFGVIFGGFHCFGWDFEYPSHFEQTLWRVTSVTITAIPFIVGPIDYFLTKFAKASRRSVPLSVLNLIMTLLLFVYVPARLSIIVQALALLRHQPQSAFVAVNWTRYLPLAFPS